MMVEHRVTLTLCLDNTNFISNDIPGASPYIQDYSPPMEPGCYSIIPADEEYEDMLHKGACEDLNRLDIHAGKQLIGYTKIVCHMIFDVKMDFTRKT